MQKGLGITATESVIFQLETGPLGGLSAAFPLPFRLLLLVSPSPSVRGFPDEVGWTYIIPPPRRSSHRRAVPTRATYTGSSGGGGTGIIPSNSSSMLSSATSGRGFGGSGSAGEKDETTTFFPLNERTFRVGSDGGVWVPRPDVPCEGAAEDPRVGNDPPPRAAISRSCASIRAASRKSSSRWRTAWSSAVSLFNIALREAGARRGE